MRIAFFGATSQISQSLIPLFLEHGSYEIDLYARNIEKLNQWVCNSFINGKLDTRHFEEFNTSIQYDVIINFIGSGDPSVTASLGASIFDITFKYDNLILQYLQSNPKCQYIFFSSGAVYGDTFHDPVTADSCATLPLNNFISQNYYGATKLFAECRHRMHAELQIVDLRIFNYFSAAQNINARFLITDILRAIRDKKRLEVSPDPIIRDFLHPQDLFQLIRAVLSNPPGNAVFDCYSKSPVNKFELLDAMKKQFGLDYFISEIDGAIVNATGKKANYYSKNHGAKKIGYKPFYTSLGGIVVESEKVISRFELTNFHKHY